MRSNRDFTNTRASVHRHKEFFPGNTDKHTSQAMQRSPPITKGSQFDFLLTDLVTDRCKETGTAPAPSARKPLDCRQNLLLEPRGGQRTGHAARGTWSWLL